MKVNEQFFQVALCIFYKVAIALNSGLNGIFLPYFRRLFICHFTLEDSYETLSSLLSLTHTLLNCWLWTSTEHLTARHN